MRPRWHKVFADLASSKSRSLLVILCIAVGVVAVGMIEGARELLARNLAESYAAAQPATIAFNLSPFDDSLVNTVRRIPGVRAAQGLAVSGVRVKTQDGAWHDVQLFGTKNFASVGVNQLLPVLGTFPPPLHQLALERSSLAFLGAQIGETLELELPNGKHVAVPVAGSVHDLNQASTFLTGSVYGYVAPETLTWLELTDSYNQLLIRTDDTQPRQAIVALAAQIGNDLRERRYVVSATTIPAIPGRLFFADSVQSMMLLLGALGIASVCSSAILVVTTMSALLAQHIREIGVMKAVGASTDVLLQMYLVTVFVFSALAILLAIPLGALGAYLMTTFSTEILNLLPVSFEVVPGAVALQIVVGLLIPFFAALSPVLAGSRISVREAIASYGLGGGDFGTSRLDLLVERVRILPRPLLLSLRNAFRRKSRLMLTLATLVVSGAVFMAVWNVRASLYTTLVQMDGFRQADLELILAAPYSAAGVERLVREIQGVAQVETWGAGEGDVRRAGSTAGERMDILGVPPNSTAVAPTLLQGRWFIPGDENALVLDADALKTQPGLKIGDRMILKRSGHDSTWQVVGITRSRLRGPLAYVPYDAWTRTQNEAHLTERVQITTTSHDPVARANVARAVESHLKANGTDVVSVQTSSEAHDADQSNFDSIIAFFTAMGILLAFVGGLGLMGTMGINVLERTREIGVLRAIGAPTLSLLQIVIVEGVLIAVMSFPFAVLLSLPLALGLNELVGHELLQASLALTFSWDGLAIWFGLVICIAAAASFVPAWSAIRLTVRNALVYE